MARPRKNNADYFSHDSNMRNDDKIKAVRKRFGHEGYSIWNMLLEKLTDADFFKIEYNDLNIELRAGDFDSSPEKVREVIEYFLMLGLLKKENNFIFSQKLIDRFEGLLCKRNRDLNRVEATKTNNNQQLKGSKKEVFASENPQSKVKESKVKERIVESIVDDDENETTPPPSYDKSLYLSCIRDAKARGQDYIKAWEQITGKKVIRNDKTFYKLSSVLNVGIDDFKNLVTKYNTISNFVTDKEKYVFEGYRGINTYTLTQFIDKAEFYLQDPVAIIKKIQDNTHGIDKLLYSWNKQFEPPKQKTETKTPQLEAPKETSEEDKQKIQELKERLKQKFTS